MTKGTSRLSIPIAPEVVLNFRRIPAGEFRMGERGISRDEEPVHTVRITRDFWMMETPVTQGQFGVVFKKHRNEFHGEALNPAERMTWDMACEFAKAVQPKAPDGWRVCLPTEAEWEYACRARSQTEYHSGNGLDALKRVGWFDANSDGKTHPAGALEPNVWGLYDMHGNVWEWCFDRYDAHAYCRRSERITDPGSHERDFELRQVDSRTKRGENPLRVLRGASWDFSAWYCRSAVRDRGHPGDRYRGIGFRLVLVPSPDEEKESEARGGPGPEAAAGAHGVLAKAAAGGGGPGLRKAHIAKRQSQRRSA